MGEGVGLAVVGLAVGCVEKMVQQNMIVRIPNYKFHKQNSSILTLGVGLAVIGLGVCGFQLKRQ